MQPEMPPTATDNSQAETEQALEQVCQYAADRMIAGVPDYQVAQELVDQGLDRETAATIIDQLRVVRNDAERKAAGKDMLVGGLWCVGGLAVTGITYAAAKGGGTYVVTWGAVIFGAFQFIRGMMRLMSR